VLGGGAPQYEREYKEPAYFEKIKAFDASTVAIPSDLKQVAEQLIAVPNIASKKAIYVQYDSMVGTGNTGTNNPSDASVVLAKPTNKGLALTTDCNSRYVFADPYKGAMIAVSEAARNIVCSGGEPIGITNCLNFGNPYDPEVYFQFVSAIKGMGEACRAFDTPVTGGNVSFYNQNPDGAVYPTPTIGMVGVLDDLDQKLTLGFKNEGDHIFLVGRSQNCIGSSEYLHKIKGVEFSPAPNFDLQEEKSLHQKISELNKSSMLLSAHDVSEGGLIVTLSLMILDLMCLLQMILSVRMHIGLVKHRAGW
jgi:phosphoribosylformylglycinamidine synthase